MTDRPEALLTVEEVSRELNVPRSWVYAKAEAGELPCFKLGRYLRFRLPELLAWLETHRRGENGRAK